MSRESHSEVEDLSGPSPRVRPCSPHAICRLLSTPTGIEVLGKAHSACDGVTRGSSSRLRTCTSRSRLHIRTRSTQLAGPAVIAHAPFASGGRYCCSHLLDRAGVIHRSASFRLTGQGKDPLPNPRIHAERNVQHRVTLLTFSQPPN
jgi:hypothetical protein